MRHYINLNPSLNLNSNDYSNRFEIGQTHILPVHHVVVLKRKLNDLITLFDGKGNSCDAVFETINKTQAIVRVQQVFATTPEPQIVIELAQCLPTLEKMDWVIEKFTELGGSVLTILEGQKNTVRLNEERASKKKLRWQELLIASCMQSQRNYLPQLNDFQTTERFFGKDTEIEIENSQRNNYIHYKFLLSPIAKTSFASQLQEINPAKNVVNTNDETLKITIAVGPESGFSTKEVELATKQGWIVVHLGNAILRTETVGLAAIALIQGILGEFI